MNNVELAFKSANAAAKLIRESSDEQRKSVDYAVIAAELIAANAAEQTQLPPFAVLICRKLAEKGKYVIFASFAEITDKLQQAIGYKNGEYSWLWEKYTQKAEILFIDDIGREKPTEWKLQKLFELIDARGKNNLPTVFTSNYSKTDLLGRISADDKNNASADAVCSRLQPFETLVLLGEDRRKR